MATVEVKCRFCHQTKSIKKHGIGKGGHQRYRCGSVALLSETTQNRLLTTLLNDCPIGFSTHCLIAG
ncbi:IS1 family transposase [Xenorhabdus sp. PB61.4]|uniref:IS1 family transposase n=1 Tax=Xenorhabdus sp. PB61.4 TaxID=2788940 RepID=UPI00351DA17D